MILSNVRTDSNLTYELGIIMTRYDFLNVRFMIFRMFESIRNLLSLTFGQLYEFMHNNDQIGLP